MPKNKPGIVVVPPLEEFWRQDGVDSIDYAHKEKLFACIMKSISAMQGSPLPKS